MQKFTYHSHTSFKNIFDGQNTAEEMISAYEQKGFTEVGISNHCIYHPTLAKMPFMSPQNFSDINKFIDIYKQSFDWIDEAASHHEIKVRKGLEVDFFPSAEWRKSFEKIIKELKPDYLIGSTHFIRSTDESFMCGIYFLNNMPQSVSREQKEEYQRNYWNNIILAAESGYFDFIAHLDYICLFDLCTGTEWDEIKLKAIDALAAAKIACEVNTKGLRKRNRPFPDWYLVQKLINKNIPLLISDDAHGIAETGFGFDIVESKLAELGCKNRFSF